MILVLCNFNFQCLDSRYRSRSGITKKPVSGSASLHGIVHDGVRRLVDHLLGLRGKRRDNRVRFWVWSEAGPQITYLAQCCGPGLRIEKDSNSNEPELWSRKATLSLEKGNHKKQKMLLRWIGTVPYTDTVYFNFKCLYRYKSRSGFSESLYPDPHHGIALLTMACAAS